MLSILRPSSLTIFKQMSAVYQPPLVCAILPTSTPELILSSLETAARIVQDNGLVAFPTETVYGLGANALDEEAVAAIFRAKGRPSDNPLIVHVSSMEMLAELIPGGMDGIPAPYIPLMKEFWPGPLSFIFSLVPSSLSAPKKSVAKAVRAGVESLALRMPSHPLALELIRKSNRPLAAPSANMSSRPSPTKAEHVRQDLGSGRGLGAILDGGDCDVGVESTVIDYHLKPREDGIATDQLEEVGEVRILRAGGVSAEEIESCLTKAGFKNAAFGKKAESAVKVYSRDFKSTELEARPTTPGMKYKHYSPSNSTVILIRRTATSPITPTFEQLLARLSGPTSKRIGLMLTTETLATLLPSHVENATSPHQILSLPSTSASPYLLDSYSIGSKLKPIESAQRLFAGLRYLDELETDIIFETPQSSAKEKEAKKGVEIILLECIEEKSVGLAFMERARKAAGGGGAELEFSC